MNKIIFNDVPKKTKGSKGKNQKSDDKSIPITRDLAREKKNKKTDEEKSVVRRSEKQTSDDKSISIIRDLTREKKKKKQTDEKSVVRRSEKGTMATGIEGVEYSPQRRK